MPAATTASALGASRSIHSGGDRLAGLGVGAECRPVAVAIDLLVGDRAFDHQHEVRQLAARRPVKGLHEVVADVIGKHRVVQMHLGQPRNGAEHHIFDTGLGGRGDRHRVAVAAEPAGDPKDMDLADPRLVFRHPAGLGLHSFAIAVRSDFGVHVSLPAI